MPISAYHVYQDPKTGQTVFLPNLFSNSIDLSIEELETWRQNGSISEDFYTSYLQEIRESNERLERLQLGEHIPASDIQDKNPLATTEYLLRNKATLYGEHVLSKIYSKLVDSDPDVIWLFVVKEATQCLKATDPLPIHFYAVREVLKNKYQIDDPKAVDILARELLEHCFHVCNFKAFQHPVFKKNPIDIDDLHEHFRNEKQSLLEIDSEFIAHLKNIGVNGKKLAFEVETNCRELFHDYENCQYADANRRALWGLWVNDGDVICPFLRLLCHALWEDKCCKLWYRETRGTPSIVKPVIERILPLLNPKKSQTFIEKDGNIILCGREGQPLLMAPAVDINMIAPFKKGVKELGTLTGHKMLRWQVNAGFERWVKGENDPRLIEIDGGYSSIAELIGCRNPREIAKIKDILHAQAHGFFKFADGSHGNMIILNILNRYRNQEPSKIRIVLGDMLLPNYIHQIERSERRLIPIGDLPPLHGGSTDSFAGQAQLQLLVFCEFSNQSVRLAKQGSVLLPIEWWKEKAVEAGLNPDKIAAIITHWCQPDLFNCFLEKQGDEYRLASYYNRQQKFLEVQGAGRIINSEKGKKSVASQKFKKSKVTKVSL